jgi:NAD(P)H-nitrite reductase large subunit
MKFTTVVKDYADVTTLSDDDLICYCTKVDKKTIVDAIKTGEDTLKAIKETTTACTGDECATLNPNKRCCSKEIKQLLKLGEKQMNKNVFKTGEGVKIAFSGAVEKQNIVKMVENCATGQCECMSDETKAKITNMEVSGKDGEVNLDLTGDVSKEEIEAALAKSKVINN